MSKAKKHLIIIAGPTGVGKTGLSLKMAEELSCPIISADSRQVYRGLDIGTDKVSLQIRDKIKHYLIDHIDIEENYSAGRFEMEVLAILQDVYKVKDRVILAGGTGFYLHTIMNGLDKFPEVSIEIKDKWKSILEHKGIHHLQQILTEKDPEYSRSVDLANPHRLIRALSVIDAANFPYSYWLQRQTKTHPFSMIPILLYRDRKELYQRINQRVDLMMEAGLLDEARQLFQKRNLQSLQTVGYKELFAYLEGEISLEKAEEEIKKNSRRYAKRQITWFKKYGDWQSFHAEDHDKIRSFIYSQMKG